MAADSVSHETAFADALDVARLDELARLAELAASYWHSVALGAERGDAPFGLAAIPSPPRHFELEPGFLGLDGSGAVLDPRAAVFGGASHLTASISA